MTHSEAVEKKEQEFGYYPQANRCSICGYQILSSRGISLFIGALLCAAVAIIVIVTRYTPGAVMDGLSIVLMLASISGMLVFGYFGEKESRAFHREQRRLFLERLDQ